MGELLTCIRDRITWYGYVNVSAPSLLKPDINVYAVLDLTTDQALCRYIEFQYYLLVYRRLES